MFCTLLAAAGAFADVAFYFCGSRHPYELFYYLILITCPCFTHWFPRRAVRAAGRRSPSGSERRRVVVLRRRRAVGWSLWRVGRSAAVGLTGALAEPVQLLMFLLLKIQNATFTTVWQMRRGLKGVARLVEYVFFFLVVQLRLRYHDRLDR